MIARLTKLQDLCTLITKGTTPTSVGYAFSDDGIPFLRVQNISGGRVNYSSETLFINDSVHAALKRSRIMPGDVLVSIAGTIGRTAVVPEDAPELNCNQAVAILRTSSELHRPYLRHWLEGPVAQGQIKGSTVTGTIQNLSLGQIGDMTIALPPLPEQRRIAAIMDKAESLRAKRREALAHLDSLAQSIFVEMLNQANDQLIRVSIEESMAAIIDYRGKTPEKKETGIPLVTARVVKGGELLEPSEFIAECDYTTWMRRGLPKDGDVLFTTEAPLGEVAQLDGRKVALAQRLLLLRGRPELLDNKFLMFSLTSLDVRKQIASRATGSTVKGIRQSELRKVILSIPPLETQRLFNRRISAVETLRSFHRESLMRLECLLESVQQQAFRAKL